MKMKSTILSLWWNHFQPNLFNRWSR